MVAGGDVTGTGGAGGHPRHRRSITSVHTAQVSTAVVFVSGTPLPWPISGKIVCGAARSALTPSQTPLS